MKISIIIPVFNAEKYLERCVDSVLASLGKISGEILLIDNGSSDNSLVLMKKIAKKHPKIISVLHCKTRGAAAVRNYGSRVSQGKYIWFIDVDDYIAQDAIPKLIKKAEKTGADIVMMGTKRIYFDGRRDYLPSVLAEEANFKSRFVRYGMGAWQVLIRRKWWLKHGFSFKEGFIHEDMELMSSLILYTDKFASVDEPLYFYCQNAGSVLHREKFSPCIFDIFPALEGLYQRFVKTKAEKKYHDELEWFFIWNLLIDSAKDFRQFSEGKPGFKRSREMLSKYFPNWRKNRFLKQKPLKLRILIRMNYWK